MLQLRARGVATFGQLGIAPGPRAQPVSSRHPARPDVAVYARRRANKTNKAQKELQKLKLGVADTAPKPAPATPPAPKPVSAPMQPPKAEQPLHSFTAQPITAPVLNGQSTVNGHSTGNAQAPSEPTAAAGAAVPRFEVKQAPPALAAPAQPIASLTAPAPPLGMLAAPAPAPTVAAPSSATTTASAPAPAPAPAPAQTPASTPAPAPAQTPAPATAPAAASAAATPAAPSPKPSAVPAPAPAAPAPAPAAAVPSPSPPPPAPKPAMASTPREAPPPPPPARPAAPIPAATSSSSAESAAPGSEFFRSTPVQITIAVTGVMAVITAFYVVVGVVGQQTMYLVKDSITFTQKDFVPYSEKRAAELQIMQKQMEERKRAEGLMPEGPAADAPAP